MLTLNQLAIDVHQTAKSKGWWEKPKKEKEVFQLILSEIAEATEEVRSNKPHCYYWDEDGLEQPFKYEGSDPLKKPEGEAVELADAFIRAMDYCGFLDIKPASLYFLSDDRDLRLNDIVKELDLTDEYDYFAGLSPLEAHYNIGASCYLTSDHRKLEQVIVRVARYFKHKGWDLEKIVELKCKYNGTRSYRHGGKAY